MKTTGNAKCSIAVDYVFVLILKGVYDFSVPFLKTRISSHFIMRLAVYTCHAYVRLQSPQALLLEVLLLLLGYGLGVNPGLRVQTARKSAEAIDTCSDYREQRVCSSTFDTLYCVFVI